MTMQPTYVKKADPKDRITWMDHFIALEPDGGVRDVIEMARHDRARSVFEAILNVVSDGSRAAA
jgi:hypothetical protein